MQQTLTSHAAGSYSFVSTAPTQQKRLLIMTDWFCPGYKAGGMISSCYNLAMLLKDEFSIYILTTDRDLGNERPYENITPNEWVTYCNNVSIFYTSPEITGIRNALTQIRHVSPDYIYMNSMYSLHFTLHPLLLKKLRLIKTPIFLSPSGMLKSNALEQKSIKKKGFLKLFRLLKIQSTFTFHAVDETEANEIRAVFGQQVRISQVYNAPPELEENITFPVKEKGNLKLVFTGRIHPMKNLHFLMECLAQVEQRVELTVVGPIEDMTYYNKCKEISDKLPANISITFAGGMPATRLKAYLREHHFLALPSLGENFGYSIVEALCTGRPALISNRTPWQDLATQKAGWNVPIDNYDHFVAILNRAAAMGQSEYNEWACAAQSYARRLLQPAECKTAYINLFDSRR
ncbi:MAG: glycosyltransferase [Niastella sp.]|nr:glycosyltransferase [Niastella sp.]